MLKGNSISDLTTIFRPYVYASQHVLFLNIVQHRPLRINYPEIGTYSKSPTPRFLLPLSYSRPPIPAHLFQRTYAYSTYTYFKRPTTAIPIPAYAYSMYAYNTDSYYLLPISRIPTPPNPLFHLTPYST